MKFASLFTFKMFLKSGDVANLSWSLIKATNHGYACHHLKTLKSKQNIPPLSYVSFVFLQYFPRKINDLGVVHKWRQATNKPSSHRHAFYHQGLSTVATKYLTSSAKTMTSFMDPLVWHQNIILLIGFGTWTLLQTSAALCQEDRIKNWTGTPRYYSFAKSKKLKSFNRGFRRKTGVNTNMRKFVKLKMEKLRMVFGD